MTKPQLIIKLQDIVDEFARNRTWGCVEVVFQNGVATMIRKESTEKLTQESNRVQYNHNNS